MLDPLQLKVKAILDVSDVHKGLAAIASGTEATQRKIARAGPAGLAGHPAVPRWTNPAVIAHVAEQHAARERSDFERGGLKGFTGAFRGTGIRVPFLGLDPAFLAGAVAASVFTQAVGRSIASVIELHHKLTALRSESGASIAETAHLSATARQFNVDTTDVTSALAGMREQSVKSNGVFAQMGISLADASGKAREPLEVFAEVRDRLSKISDPALQAAAAQAIFGESYLKILPLIRASSSAIKDNAAAIDAQAAAQVAAAAAGKHLEERSEKAKKNLGGFFEFFGGRLAENLAVTSEQLETTFGRLDAYNKSLAESRAAHLSDREANAAAEQAAQAAEERINRTRATEATANVPIRPAFDIAALQSVVTTLRAAKQQSDALNESLLSIGQARLDRTFQIASAEIDLQNTRFDREQALANQQEDHLTHLREQSAALTRSLGEFRAQEQSAALRAREQERSFVAFRPDNAMLRADEEHRYQRDRAQEQARNARLEAAAARQLAHQQEVTTFEVARELRQETIIKREREILAADEPNLEKRQAVAEMGLAAARLARDTAGIKQEVELHVQVTSPDGSVSKLDTDQIGRIVISVLTRQAAEALTIVRSGIGPEIAP